MNATIAHPCYQLKHYSSITIHTALPLINYFNISYKFKMQSYRTITLYLLNMIIKENVLMLKQIKGYMMLYNKLITLNREP